MGKNCYKGFKKKKENVDMDRIMDVRRKTKRVRIKNTSGGTVIRDSIRQ